MGDPNRARRAGLLRRGSFGRLPDSVDDQISCACVGHCWSGSVLGEESEHDSAKSRTVPRFRAGAPGSGRTVSAGLTRMERGWAPASDSATSASKEDKHLVASATDEKANVVVRDDDNGKDAKAIKAQIAKELKKELGPGSDFEKEMKNLGEELKKELGPGSDFEKEMKNLGEELTKELGPGSDFGKQMKNLGEELEKAFGPGSDFEKQIMSKGKEIEGKFGPGSDFEQKMQRLGKQMEARFGEGSEFAEKMKNAANGAKAAKTSSDTSSDRKAKTKTKARKKRDTKTDTSTSKASEVRALKAQIDDLNAQLKKLQEADGDERD